VDRLCPECGGVLTPLEDVDEYASARGRFLCSECQMMFEVDPARGLREVDE
jgi:hypothetical protein